MTITTAQIDAFDGLIEIYNRGLSTFEEERAGVLYGVLANATKRADKILPKIETDPRGESAMNALQAFFSRAVKLTEEANIAGISDEIREVAAALNLDDI